MSLTSHLNFEVDPSNDNQKSILHSFFKNKSFVDVTLISDDGQYLQAHKVILSSISEVFSNILQNYTSIPNCSNSLLYMKGVKFDSLLLVLDFIYLGKTSVPMNKLADFMTLAKDLKVNGLLEDEQDTSEERNIVKENPIENSVAVSNQNVNEFEHSTETVPLEATSTEQDVNIKLENIDDHETRQKPRKSRDEVEYKIIEMSKESGNKEHTHAKYRLLIDSLIHDRKV